MSGTTMEESREDSRTRESVHLIRRFQAGEKAALDLLFARYWDRVHRIVAVRVVGAFSNSCDVDDVVQETFMAAMRSFDQFELREECRLIHWLARIAQNKLIDAMKHEHRGKRDRGRELSLEGLYGGTPGQSSIGWDIVADSTQVFERVERAELAETLDRALSELDERQREVILLRDYALGSWEFVAQELGCVSDEAARKLYSRARVALGSKLQGRL